MDGIYFIKEKSKTYKKKIAIILVIENFFWEKGEIWKDDFYTKKSTWKNFKQHGNIFFAEK